MSIVQTEPMDLALVAEPLPVRDESLALQTVFGSPHRKMQRRGSRDLKRLLKRLLFEGRGPFRSWSWSRKPHMGSY